MQAQHPLTRARYERLEDGNVRVSGDGTSGIFDKDGQWISGEHQTADPLMCIWIATRPVSAAPGLPTVAGER